MKQDLGEDIDVEIAFLNLQGGQYKQMMEKSFTNFCRSLYMETSKTFFENYQAHTIKPVAWKTCPYPAGQNEVKNFHVSDGLFMIPPYLPGSEKWKVELKLTRGEEVLGGYNLYAILRSEHSLLDISLG